MASSLNKVQLIGNLGKDPEIRTMKTGDRVAHLSVATSERWKGKDGEFKERTEWHKVTIWVQGLVKYLESVRKGSRIYVEGSLETEKWTDQQGVEKYRTVIMLRNHGATVILLDQREQGQAESSASDQYVPPAQSDALEDDIPF